MNGSGSDSLLALDPETGKFVVLRVPYPLGFYSRGLDGRIDDPKAAGRAAASGPTTAPTCVWHIEGGKGTLAPVVKFQLRPEPARALRDRKIQNVEQPASCHTERHADRTPSGEGRAVQVVGVGPHDSQENLEDRMRKVLRVITLGAWALVVAGAGTALAQNKAFTAQDYVEIEQLYARYNDAIDTGNADVWVGTFTADGVFNTFKGQEALRGFVEQWKGKMNGTRLRHWNTNLRITPTADGASGAVYLMLLDVSAKPPAITSAAQYTDALVKTPEGWRFKSRATRGDTAPPPPKPVQ